ncbi:hypothetical protein BV20DRAFT_559315 [Pilatotrama ljubarskyi]|nr:hypothetical protein BV20DRAFT_559315 [Pilatotrama ljubarskyi]
MPHSLVVARLDPARSAFWIPRFGRLAASKIVTIPFWALRVSLVNEDEVQPIVAPGTLFVISTQPSPIHIPNASLTLGPRLALDSKRIGALDAQLTTTRSLHSSEACLEWPLYVHTIPRLRIHYSSQKPLTTMHYELDRPSLLKFKDVALDNQLPALDYYYREVRPRQAWIPATESIPDKWTSFSGRRHRYVLGAANSPRAYCFDFLDDYLPCFESPATVYEETYLFHQVCKDYTWHGAVDTIEWVISRRLRATESQDHPCAVHIAPSSFTCEDDSLRSVAQQLYALPSPHLGTPAKRGKSSPSSTDSWNVYTTSSDYPYLPASFKFLYEEFESILGRPRVVVLEIFGVILDRESAILERALSAWPPFACRGVSLDKMV